jgi:hypothetical protein
MIRANFSFIFGILTKILSNFYPKKHSQISFIIERAEHHIFVSIVKLKKLFDYYLIICS